MTKTKVLFALACMLPLWALAQNPYVPGTPFIPLPSDYFETAGRQTVGNPINNLTLPGGRRLFDDANLSTDGGPNVNGIGRGDLTNPSGNKFPVDVKRQIPPSEQAKIIGRGLGRLALKVAVPLTVGLELYDLGKELGYDLKRKPDGTIDYEKVAGGTLSTDCSTSPRLTASSLVELANNCAANRQAHFRQNVPGQTGCVATAQLGVDQDRFKVIYSATCSGDATYFVTGTPGSVAPATRQQFIDAVASKSGWPASSNIGRALEASTEKGDPAPVTTTPTVTGPATSPGTITTTNNTTNNTTKTETTTHHHTYAGDKVSTTTITNTTVINNTTGDTISNETITTTPPPAAEPVETCGLPGKPACVSDETGVPEQPEIDAVMSKTKVDDITKDLNDMIADPAGKLPTLPSINWAFVLPTGCAVLPLPAFDPFIAPIDICQFQPMFHDLMSIVWTLGGLFGAISLFMKNALSH